MQSSFACRHSAYRIGLVGWRRRQTLCRAHLACEHDLPSGVVHNSQNGWAAMPTTSGSKSSSNPVPATTHTRQGIRSWPSTSGRHDCAAPCRTETRAPASTPRTAPTTRRSAPGAARRTRHRRRRSRTPGPLATPDAPPRTTLTLGTGKQSSGRTGPTSSKSATYVRTPQPRPQTNPELRNLDPNRTAHSTKVAAVWEPVNGVLAPRTIRGVGTRLSASIRIMH
jgi:hypothetical protein